MELSADQRQRLREIGTELKEMVGGCVEDDLPLTFAAMEEECIEVSNLLSTAMLQERVAERELPVEACWPT